MRGALVALLLAVVPALALAQSPRLTNPNIMGGSITSPSILGGANVNGPLVWLNPTPTQHMTYASGGLTNGVIISAGGNSVSYCPVLSCITAPSNDHQRTSALFWATTRDDGHSEEQTVGIQTIIQTGYARMYANGTAYAVGDNIENPASGQVYRVTQSGTTSPTGTGPAGTGTAIMDGSVRMDWINAASINAKVGLYNEVQVKPGGGKSWAQANNIQLEPGLVPTFNINTELDFTNNATDCLPGTNCIGLEMNMAGHKSTAGIHLGSTNTAGYASLYGIRLNGDKLASDAALEITTTSRVGIGFGTIGFGTSSHSTATIQDASSSPISLLIQGTHSAQSINDISTTPAALNLAGTYSLAGVRVAPSGGTPYGLRLEAAYSSSSINDIATAPASLNASGTYSVAAVTTQGATTGTALLAAPGQKVCWNSTASTCVTVNSSGKMILSRDSTNLFSIDASGNVVAKGTITASGTP